MSAVNDGALRPGSISRHHLTFASLIVFPVVGPGAIALAAGLPLAVMGLFILGPGGLLYYLILMIWWMPALYAVLALPYFLTGVLVALAGVVLGRASLLVALIAAEFAFAAYLAVSYLIFGRIVAIGTPDYVNFASMLRAPGAVLVVLAGAAICWFVVHRVARPPAARIGWWRRSIAIGAAIAGAAGLAAVFAQGARVPEVAWRDCTDGGWDDRMRGCTVIIERGDHEPVARRVTAYLRRGAAYEEPVFKNDLTRAIADYTEAIRLDPLSAAAFIRRGLAHFSQGDYDRTLADTDMALKLDPNLGGEMAYRVFRVRGLAFFHKGAFDHAIDSHAREIAFAPHYADGYLNRGAAHTAKKDYERALADFTDAIRVEVYRPEGYIGRGDIHLLRGDADRALAEFDEAIKRSPSNRRTAPAYRKRGEILEARGDVAGALAAYEAAVRLDPADKSALAGRERMRAGKAR
jgi:tetratricopeptide (TPR) repeat protein